MKVATVTVAVTHRPAPQRTTAPIRSLADWQADRVERFVARRPEYARLPVDVLLQYAETYRDDSDHTLEQEYRDNGVLRGCRIDHSHAARRGDGWIPFSDDLVLEAS